MSGRDLDAAGILQPELRASYELCRELNARHGKTYYLATLLLPRHKRPAVHALYGFARYADEFVDSFEVADPEALTPWGERFLRDLSRGTSDDPVCRATVHAATTWSIPETYFVSFLRSMAMDLTVTSYATYDDLRDYMYGSAAVIGLQMVPVLEPLSPAAYAPARALGEAFQLTNFLRDVEEDLRRGRLYLPLEDLARFGVTRGQLERGELLPSVRALIAFEVARTRRLYAEAEPGIGLLHPTSRDCVRTAWRLYGGILDAIEARGYDVLSDRARVGLPRRLGIALPALVRAAAARRENAAWKEWATT